MSLKGLSSKPQISLSISLLPLLLTISLRLLLNASHSPNFPPYLFVLTCLFALPLPLFCTYSVISRIGRQTYSDPLTSLAFALFLFYSAYLSALLFTLFLFYFSHPRTRSPSLSYLSTLPFKHNSAMLYYGLLPGGLRFKPLLHFIFNFQSLQLHLVRRSYIHHLKLPPAPRSLYPPSSACLWTERPTYSDRSAWSLALFLFYSADLSASSFALFPSLFAYSWPGRPSLSNLSTSPLMHYRAMLYYGLLPGGLRFKSPLHFILNFQSLQLHRALRSHLQHLGLPPVPYLPSARLWSCLYLLYVHSLLIGLPSLHLPLPPTTYDCLLNCLSGSYPLSGSFPLPTNSVNRSFSALLRTDKPTLSCYPAPSLSLPPSASPTTRVNFPSGMSPNKWSHIYLGNKNWKRKSGLKFGSFNVGGGYLSKGKILEVEHYMKTQNIDILAVSEIEMNKSKFHQEALYRIKGYTMYLPPSWSSIGKARILLYVKDSIEHHVTLRSDLSPQLQPVIWIQINSNPKLFVAFIYREWTDYTGDKSLSGQLRRLSEFLEKAKKVTNEQLTILGDFNVNAEDIRNGENCSLASLLHDFMLEMGLIFLKVGQQDKEWLVTHSNNPQLIWFSPQPKRKSLTSTSMMPLAVTTQCYLSSGR